MKKCKKAAGEDPRPRRRDGGRAPNRGRRRPHAARGAGTAAGVVASGMMNHAARYATTPRTIAPGTTVRIAHATRTTVGSVDRYSAMPPQTPAILRSTTERVSPARTAGDGAGVSGMMTHAA